MKKQFFILATLMMLSVSAMAVQGELGIDLDATWVSKYIWRGFDMLDDKAAFQPSVNIDLYGTGFSFNIWTSQACSSKNGGSVSTVDAEEWDYSVTYANMFHEGEQYQTNYAASWLYYNFPDRAAKDGDQAEFNVAFSWPNICEFGVVPEYTIVYLYSARGDGAMARSEPEGFIHIFGLGYDYDCPALQMPLSLSWDLVYNDGAGGATVDHDWSHTVFGVSTSFDAPMGGTFTPGVYYQISMDESVNNENELWVALSYGLKF